MRNPSSQRGATLIEAMAAMAVLMIGAAGMVGLSRQSTFFVGDARRATRAANIGTDLVNQIELWDYDDPRLADADTSNNADVGNTANGTDVFDHGEADLTLGGRTFTGIPSTLLEAAGMERYWNVAPGDDFNGNGVADSKKIAVVVRWQTGASYRRAVFMVTKINTADVR